MLAQGRPALAAQLAQGIGGPPRGATNPGWPPLAFTLDLDGQTCKFRGPFGRSGA